MERITSVLPVPPVIFLRAAGCLVTNGVAAIGSKGVLKRMDSKQKAEELVNGKRQADYGHPKVNMKRIARIWSGILDMEVTPEQVALCMVGLKLARLVSSPDHEDTQVDMLGYLKVLQRLLDPDDQPALKYEVKWYSDPAGTKIYADGSKDMTFEEACGEEAAVPKHAIPIKNGVRLLNNPSPHDVKFALGFYPHSTAKWNMDGTVDIIFANFFCQGGQCLWPVS